MFTLKNQEFSYRHMSWRRFGTIFLQNGILKRTTHNKYKVKIGQKEQGQHSKQGKKEQGQQ